MKAAPSTLPCGPVSPAAGPTRRSLVRNLGIAGLGAAIAPTSWLAASGAAHAASAESAEIFIYYSDTTAQYFSSQRRAYTQVVRRWSAVLQAYGEHAHELTRSQLLAGTFRGVLILPTAVALDDAERAAVMRFAQGGGSVMGTGAVGTRNATGQLVGNGFLEQLFQVQTHGFFPPRDDSYFMPHGDGPITWPVPAARRVPLALGRDTVLRVVGRNEAAVVMDWSRSGSELPMGTMTYDEIGPSRRVYLSAPDDAWPRSVESGLVLDAAIAWLRRQAQAFKAAWPSGFAAAHLIEMDTEDQFQTAPLFATQLEAEGLCGTFYCLTSEAIRWPDIVRDLKKRGHEIAYHADVHFGFRGDSIDEQELRIRFMKQQMGSILGAELPEATGFRAPTESYDANTERLLRKHGLLHHAADESAHEDRLPFFSLAEPGVPSDKALVVLPRSQMDDVTFTRLKLTPEQVKPILFHDIDLAIRSGAFSLLSVHSQYYAEGALMNRAMPDYLRKVAGHRGVLWAARGDQITRWWRQRDAVSIKQSWRGDTLDITLGNASRSSVAGLSVWVTLPGRSSQVRVAGVAGVSEGGARQRPTLKRIDDFRVAIVFDELPPGETRAAVRFR